MALPHGRISSALQGRGVDKSGGEQPPLSNDLLAQLWPSWAHTELSFISFLLQGCQGGARLSAGSLQALKVGLSTRQKPVQCCAVLSCTNRNWIPSHYAMRGNALQCVAMLP